MKHLRAYKKFVYLNFGTKYTLKCGANIDTATRVVKIVNGMLFQTTK